MPKYFSNLKVHDLLVRYHKTNCTCAYDRDLIMKQCVPLIDGIVKRYTMYKLMPNSYESNIDELRHVGWVAIEKVLYKYDVHHARPFSFISAVAYQALLAYAKSDRKDHTYLPKTGSRLGNHNNIGNQDVGAIILDLRAICKGYGEFESCVEAVEEMVNGDDPTPIGWKSKLRELTGLPKKDIETFLTYIRSRVDDIDFTGDMLDKAPRGAMRWGLPVVDNEE